MQSETRSEGKLSCHEGSNVSAATKCRNDWGQQYDKKRTNIIPSISEIVFTSYLCYAYSLFYRNQCYCFMVYIIKLVNTCFLSLAYPQHDLIKL